MIALPSWRDWLFSVKAFTAAMLALFVAMGLGLPRPYWAMATVYVVSNPLTGATGSSGSSGHTTGGASSGGCASGGAGAELLAFAALGLLARRKQ